MRNLLVAALAVLTLGGCYELPHPIFHHGHRALVVGTYECSGMTQSCRDTITESSTGLIWKSYRYTNSSGETLTMRNIGGTTFAAQIESKDGIYISYFDIPGPHRFLIRTPDLLRHTNAINALSSETHVTSRTSERNKDFISLSGTDKNLEAFVTGHNPDFLTTVMDCKSVTSYGL